MLLSTGADGSCGAGRCPFGALPCPFPPSDPGRIHPSLQRILAESHHLGTHSRSSGTDLTPPRFTAKMRYRTQGFPGVAVSHSAFRAATSSRLPRRGARPLPPRGVPTSSGNARRLPPPRKGKESRSLTRRSRSRHTTDMKQAGNGESGPRVRAASAEGTDTPLRRPGRAVSLPRVQDSGTYSRSARPVETGR